ncbi:MAG: hypothetical protein PVG07_02515 [Acidobacteriota bacterium]|jgi:hypothetical protein
MTLRTKLLLGYGYLVGLLLLVAGSAMVGFLGLSERLQTAVDDSMRTAQAVTTDLEAERLRERTLLAAEREARTAALQSGTWLGFLVLVALVSLVLLSRALQRQILLRLEALRSGVASIAIGEHRRLWEEGRDELALIARQVNGLLDRYEELEGRLRGRLAQERRVVLGLLGATGEEAALFDLAGDRLAGEVDLGDAEEVAIDWIRDRGRRLVEAGEPVTESIPGSAPEGGRELQARLLLAPGARPAGWLVG